MFGPKNGMPQPSGGRLASHKQLSQGNATTASDAGALRRRLSTDSINSAASNTNINTNTSGGIRTSHSQQQLHTLKTNGHAIQNKARANHKELNIQVVLRCRERSEREKNDNSPVVVEGLNKEIHISLPGERARQKMTFAFDRVFMYSDQESIYNEVVTPILDEVLMGYNCTIFAYGQTGTGKTHTMEGDLRDHFGECSREAGIIPRTLYRLFADLEKKETEYSVRISFLELYNEEVKDLLGPEDNKKVVKIYDISKSSGPLVQGLEEFAVFNATQGIEILRRGSARRTVAATKSNDKSSRSHGVFSITVHVKETTDDGEELLKVGKLNLVDLAGSENIARSGAESNQAREAGRINQSLLTLGRVINCLVDGYPHIPYRESKLTRLLEDSLGGKTRTCIIATISPARSCMEETLSTLHYANRAKNIKNTPEINQKMSKKTLIKEYLLEIDRLKADLNATREKNGVFMTTESHQALLDENASNKDLVGETQKRVDKIQDELKRVEEKFRENMALLTEAEFKLGRSVAELEIKQAELQTAEDNLAQTKQELEEEKLLRQAHAHTESRLNNVAAELRSTLSTSVKDIKGLHEKLDRKSAMEREKRRILQEFQERVMGLSNDLGQRLNHFETANDLLLSAVTQRMDEACKESIDDAKSARKYVEGQLERMAEAVRAFQDSETTGSEKSRLFHQEFEALRTETSNFLRMTSKSTTSTSAKGFESLKKALQEFVGMVERHHDSVAKKVGSLVEESSKFSEESIRGLEEALDRYRQSTKAEVDFLTLQNQELRQRLQEQESIAAKQKGALLADIGGLLDGFLKTQSGAMMGHFTKVCDALDGSAGRLHAAHEQHQLKVGDLSCQGHQHLQQLEDSRQGFEISGMEAKAERTQHSDGLFQQSDHVLAELQEAIETQYTVTHTRISKLSDAALDGYRGLQDHSATAAKAYKSDSAAAVSTIQELGCRAGLSSKAAQGVHRQTSEDMGSLKTAAHAFGENARSNMEETQTEIQNAIPRQFKDESSTGRTPSRRHYKYPHTWGLTRPSVDILKEFREMGRVELFTTEEGSESMDLGGADDGRGLLDCKDISLPRQPSPLGVNNVIVGSEPVAVASEPTVMLDPEPEIKSPLMPPTRRLSLRDEAEKEKENSAADLKPLSAGAGGPLQGLSSRSSRLTKVGGFAAGFKMDRPEVKRPGFNLASVAGTSVPLKRLVSDMEEEPERSHAGPLVMENAAINLIDISNSSRVPPGSSSAPSSESLASRRPGTGPVATSIVRTTMGMGFGAGKSGQMNMSDGPRKVARKADRPTRPLPPFGRQ